MHSSTKKAAEPKRLTKNGKVYGDLLSAEEKKKLEKYIGAIKDDQTRMIFRLRFIHCMTWPQVAEAIGGRNTASSVRAICYRHLKSCSGANTRER